MLFEKDLIIFLPKRSYVFLMIFYLRSRDVSSLMMKIERWEVYCTTCYFISLHKVCAIFPRFLAVNHLRNHSCHWPYGKSHLHLKTLTNHILKSFIIKEKAKSLREPSKRLYNNNYNIFSIDQQIYRFNKIPKTCADVDLFSIFNFKNSTGVW